MQSTHERPPPRAAVAGRPPRSPEPCRGRLCLALTTALLLAETSAAAQLAPTPSSGIGVWYQPDAPETGELWRPGDAGRRLFLRGRVLDTGGDPVGDAQVELWHADADGAVHPDRYRARLRSRADGQFEVSTVLPGYIWGPRHIHFVVTHANHERLITRIFFKRDPEVAVTGDPALAVLLEDGRLGGEEVLLGEVHLILRKR